MKTDDSVTIGPTSLVWNVGLEPKINGKELFSSFSRNLLSNYGANSVLFTFYSDVEEDCSL